MYKKCAVCGTYEDVYYTRFSEKEQQNVSMCETCKTKHDKDLIEKRLVQVESARDFKEWSSEDMSEAFWIHLGKYQKRPNKYSLSIMIRAFTWACHADHGLSNSFDNAMRWCGIDWANEKNRTDIPEK